MRGLATSHGKEGSRAAEAAGWDWRNLTPWSIKNVPLLFFE